MLHPKRLLLISFILLASCGGGQVAYQPTPTRVIATSTTSTPLPTLTPQPTATIAPTRVPNEEFWKYLKRPNADLVATQIKNSDGYIYSAYIINDRTTAEFGCGIYFFRWDGYENKLIYTERPQYVSQCFLVNWDRGFTSREYNTLHLKGSWSDINGNGKLELAIIHDRGCASCDDRNFGQVFLYEIQDMDKVVNIIKDISPSIRIIDDPGYILHSENPLTIYLHELVQYDMHAYIRKPFVYQWDGIKYVDVSARYVDEFRTQAKQIAAEIKKRYGGLLPDWGGNVGDKNIHDMLKILVLYSITESPRKEGLDLFLEVTDLSHWTGTAQQTLCGLQIVRAYAQVDYEQGIPFRIFSPAFDERVFTGGGFFSSAPYPRPALKDLIPKGLESRFDFTACK